MWYSDRSFPLLALWGVVWLAGCGDRQPAAPPQPQRSGEKPPEKPSAELPDIPGVDPSKASADIIVSNPAEKREYTSVYVQDDKLQCGTLRGKVKLPKGGEQTSKPLIPENFAEAIRQPQEKEVEYYKYYISPKRFCLEGRRAVVALRGIKTGKLAPLDRQGPVIWCGSMIAKFGLGYGYGMEDLYLIAMVDDRVILRNADPFPFEILAANSAGKTVFEAALEPHRGTRKGELLDEINAWNKDIEGCPLALKQKDLDRYTQLTGKYAEVKGNTAVSYSNQTGPWAMMAKMYSIPPLREVGVYPLSCKRHCWFRAYVLVLDNPYFAMTRDAFNISGVPTGKYTLEIWHPFYEPLNKTMTVEIRENETTEISIEFKPPR